jgi:3-hydroxyacyl-CoA dehydrogenase
MFGAGGRRGREARTAVTRVAVLGTDPTAAQIGCEYALGGCSVLWSSDDAGADVRVEEALRFAAGYGLADPPELERARSLMKRGDPTISSVERLTLIVDAQSGPLAPRAAAIAEIAGRHPEALVATTALAPGPTELGEAAEVGERMLATRYGEPPLLCPVVELLTARDTPRRLLDRVSQLLRALGKRPVALRREVPGFVSGRLELALLRETAWLLERGAVDAEDLDELVRDSLARRWALAGPVESGAIAPRAELAELAAAGTDARALDALAALAQDVGPERAAALRERRDQGLAAALREDRAGSDRPSGEDG